MIVEVGKEGQPVEIEDGDHAHMARLIGSRDFDHTSLSRKFHVFVYGRSVLDNWPPNFFVARVDRAFMLHGPVLVYRVGEHGETTDLTPIDIENIRDHISASRMGIIIDSLGLDNDA